MSSKTRQQLRRVEQFSDDPTLQRSVAEFERNTARAVGEVASGKVGTLKPTHTVTGDYQARWGEIILCDPSGGAFQVFLPRADKSHAGQRIIIKNSSGSANTITVLAGSSTKIDNGATLVIAAVRATMIVEFDGKNWWKVN